MKILGWIFDIVSRPGISNPHDGYEAALLLNGAKPIGMLCVVTGPERDYSTEYAEFEQKLIAQISRLDQAVAEGKLSKRQVVVPSCSWLSGLGLVGNFYCQPGLEADMDMMVHFHATAWNGEPEPPIPKNPGFYLGYTENDVKLFEGGGYLSADELSQHRPHHHAAARLLEYLRLSLDDEVMAPPASLKGIYEMRRVDDQRLVVTALTIHEPLETGLIEITKVEEHYSAEVAASFDSLSPKERADVLAARSTYAGWGILTPEDNLLMFLKKERTAANQYHLTLVETKDMWGNEPVRQLVLLHHEYPLDPQSGWDLERVALEDAVLKVLSASKRNVMFFNRLRGDT